MTSQSASSSLSVQCAVAICTRSARLSPILLIPIVARAKDARHIKMCQSRICVNFTARRYILCFPFHILLCYSPNVVKSTKGAPCLASHATKPPPGRHNDRGRKAAHHRSGLVDHRSGARMARGAQHHHQPLGPRCGAEIRRAGLSQGARPGADPLPALRPRGRLCARG